MKSAWEPMVYSLITSPLLPFLTLFFLIQVFRVAIRLSEALILSITPPSVNLCTHEGRTILTSFWRKFPFRCELTFRIRHRTCIMADSGCLPVRWIWMDLPSLELRSNFTEQRDDAIHVSSMSARSSLRRHVADFTLQVS